MRGGRRNEVKNVLLQLANQRPKPAFVAYLTGLVLGISWSLSQVVLALVAQNISSFARDGPCIVQNINNRVP